MNKGHNYYASGSDFKMGHVVVTIRPDSKKKDSGDYSSTGGRKYIMVLKDVLREQLQLGKAR